jgi:hypothetical protein
LRPMSQAAGACYTGVFPGVSAVGRIATRTLCNFSLRTASGPEGSSAK